MPKKGLITKFIKLIFKMFNKDRIVSIHLLTNDLIVGKIIKNDQSIQLLNAVFVKFGTNEVTEQSYMYFVNYNPLSTEEDGITTFRRNAVVSINTVDDSVMNHYNDFIKKDTILTRNRKKSLENKNLERLMEESLQENNSVYSGSNTIH